MSAGAEDFARWEQSIEAANAAFEREDDESARTLYRQAITLARQLLDSCPWLRAGPDADARVPVFDAAVAAVVVSHHNAANRHKRSGRPEDVAALYRAAHLAVRDLSVDPDLEEALRMIAGRHITRTLGEFTHYLRSCGALAGCDAGTPSGAPDAGVH